VRNGAKKRPSESVVNVRLPCGETTVTVAPGIARFCASTTWPAIDPVVFSCAMASVEHVRMTNKGMKQWRDFM